MSEQTPYEVLGLPVTATKIEAERAWKKAVRSLHPDAFPEEEREGLTVRLAEVNRAWGKIKKGWSPLRPDVTDTSPNLDSQDEDTINGRIKRGSEIPLFYSQRDPLVARFLENLRAVDEKESQQHFFKKLFPGIFLGKLPKRDPLHVSLCAAVVIEGRVLTYMFHAPLPSRRCALIVPQIKNTSGGVNVIPNKPEAIHLSPKSKLAGTISPFPAERAQELGLDRIDISLPSRTFDMTKSFDLVGNGGMASLIYKN